MHFTIFSGHILVFACAAAIAMSGSALAGTSMTDKSVSLTTRSLDLTLTGTLASRCQASGGGTIDFGNNVTGGLEAQGRFGLDCNIPFALKVSSAKGGLTHATAPLGQGPFAGILRYTMDVRVPTQTASGAGPIVGGVFSSEARNRTFTSGVDAIAEGGGTLLIKTADPDGAGLLAGEYSDTVTITVTAL